MKDSDLNDRRILQDEIFFFLLPSLKEMLMSILSSFYQTGTGPQAADKDPQHVLGSLLVQRHVQSSPRRHGGSPLGQQLSGWLWNHTNGQGTLLPSSPSPVALCSSHFQLFLCLLDAVLNYLLLCSFFFLLCLVRAKVDLTCYLVHLSKICVHNLHSDKTDKHKKS